MREKMTAKTAILRCMCQLDGPVGATKLTARLVADGILLQPRTVRLYLLQMDREGLTRFVSRRRGRELTTRGRDEAASANIMEKVGFIAAKIDSLGYRMTYRHATGRGSIIANIATISTPYLARALEYMKPVFTRRLGMGTKLAIAREGELLGGLQVPRGTVALGTVCSMTVNGAMLAERIPVTSRFGGLLEMREGKPVRFLELMDYRGTTMDPLEFFINAKMTRVRECARTGSGILGASFREFPTVATEEAQRLIRHMERDGLGGILTMGQPNQPLLNIPVTEGRTGMIVVGGLNPIAALYEAGAQVTIQSLAGLENFESFLPFQTIWDRFPNLWS
jgi:hypothetical protein